jgi:cellobiose-specific phosphotransferase system component IIC
MISPMILVNAVYTIIDSFTTKSNVVMSFISGIYNDPVNGGQVVASAMSWMYFLVVILVIAAVAGLLSAYTFYQRRD